MPFVHGTHCRSAVALPATDCPQPAAHVCHAMQLSLPAIENVPPAHAVHELLCASDQRPAAHCRHEPPPAAAAVPAAHGTATAPPLHALPAGHGPHWRLADTVGAASSTCTALHASTAPHASPLLYAEYVESATHAAQLRSAVDEPGTDSPSPAGQSRHGVHDVEAAPEKVPLAHASHDPASLAACVPAEHATQVADPAAAAYPSSHCTQTPVPWPAAYPAPHCTITALPLQACPLGHAPHTRFDDCDGADSSYWLTALHCSTARHTLSLIDVGAACVY